MIKYSKTIRVNASEKLRIEINEHDNIVLTFFENDCEHSHIILHSSIGEFIDIFRIYFKTRRMERSPLKLTINFFADFKRSMRLRWHDYFRSLRSSFAIMLLNLLENIGSKTLNDNFQEWLEQFSQEEI